MPKQYTLKVLHELIFDDAYQCFLQAKRISNLFLQLLKYMSADLTKGSFGHFRRCCVIKFQTRLNFQDFECSYNSLKLHLTCNTIKGANNSDKSR